MAPPSSDPGKLADDLQAWKKRAQRLERIAKRRRYSAQLQSALYHIADVSGADLSMSEFMEKLHAIMRELMYAENFFIALYDEARQRVSFVYYADAVDEDIDIKQLQNIPITEMRGTLTNMVLRTGEPLFVNQEALNLLEISGEIGNNGADCIEWLGVPLKLGKRMLGVMAVQTYDDSKHYRASDRKLLQFVSKHIATAVDRKQNEFRLMERTQALAETNAMLEQLLLQRKQISEKLAHDAHHDALTGLPNRALLTERLQQAIKRHQRHKTLSFALLFLDLDRFKVINDSLGHLLGDQLLCEVSGRLLQCVRPGDTVARLGGDEFCILLDDIHDLNDVILIAERVLKKAQQAYMLDEHQVFTSASIGITLSNFAYQTPEACLRDADAAMYQAKANGKNRFCIFDPGMHESAVQRLKLEADLRHAIARNEILIYYQPVVDLRTQRIRAFEALARWQHPTLGMVSPAQFIPLAEETGLINDIGLFVLRESVKQTRQWQTDFHNPQLAISVNLSGRQLAQRLFLQQVQTILDSFSLAPESLKLEITESILIHNFESAQAFLQELQKMRIEILLDDFGTGYSSLNYLHQFPLDTVKIDRAFVKRLNAQDKSIDLLEGIRLLTRKLGLTLVAEGVEEAAQVELLTNLQIEFGQGYYFGAPMPAPHAQQLLSKDTLKAAAVVT